MMTNGVGVKIINTAVSFRPSWNGRCDGCDRPILEDDECWFWVDDILSPIVHSQCFVAWVRQLPNELHSTMASTLKGGYGELAHPHFAAVDPDKCANLRNRARPTEVALGGFMDYVNDWTVEVSQPAARLNELYDSITIWEVYKRLLPGKPHKPYRPDGETSAACPHESGQNSLSMWINDAKGLYFCAHAWEGNNKMALYCEIRGLANKPELFHKLKQLMVWEFRGEDPYSTAT